MKRRDFITLAGAVVAFPSAAFAQQPARLPRVAYLDTPRPKYQTDGLFQGLAERGYIDGKNIVVEWFTAATAAELPTVAARAVASAPTVIVAGGANQALAAAQVTKTIPIVFRSPQDPVSLGLVSNLAHPGGNITGAALLGSVLAAKEFGFLKEMVPGLSRIASFGKSTEAAIDAIQRADVLAAGKATGIDIIMIDVEDPDDLRPYFAQALAAGAQSVYAAPYSFLTMTVPWDAMNALSAGQRQQPTFNAAFLSGNNNMSSVSGALAYLASLNGLPSLSGSAPTPGIATGYLLTYGESAPEAFRRTAYFVDDILRGAKPQDLPVELPTKYDLQINLKTAKALGLGVPPNVLITATEVLD